MKQYKITCDYCDSENVVKNVAECMVEYDFDSKTQNYSEKPTLINDPIESKHYCKECYDKWCEGELF